MISGVALAIAGVVWFVNREFPTVPPVAHTETPGVISKPHHEAHAAPPAELMSQVDASNSLVNAPALPAPDPVAMAAKIKADTIERLMDLSANEDSGSLTTILSELENPDKEIRAAALEAAVQFGERTNTIARISDLLQRTEDEDERTALREAIEFIKLPSLTEVVAARKAAGGVASTARSQQPPLASAARMPNKTLGQPRVPTAPSISK